MWLKCSVVIATRLCPRHSVSNYCTRKHLPIVSKRTEVTHPYLLLLYHCVPMAILVSQQWHLNVPTHVSQRQRAVAYVNSPKVSSKASQRHGPESLQLALIYCWVKCFLLRLLEDKKSHITAQLKLCGHKDTGNTGKTCCMMELNCCLGAKDPGKCKATILYRTLSHTNMKI